MAPRIIMALLPSQASGVTMLGLALLLAAAPQASKAAANPGLLQQATCPPSAAVDGGCWVEILHEVAYHGASQGSGGAALVSGSFEQVRAIHVSGWISCDEHGGRPLNHGGYPWQACGPGFGSFWSFELMHQPAGGGLQYVFEQPNWNTLPAQCSPPSSSAGAIVCTPSSVWNVQAGDTVIPTWYEPSHSTSLHDNGGTHIVNIEGWIEFVCDLPASEWLETEFMPALDVAATGFNTGVKDEFVVQFSYHRKYYDVVPSSGAVDTSNGLVHAHEIDGNNICWDIHRVRVPWGTLVSECARGEEGGASGFVTYTCKIEIDARETLSPIRGAAIGREIHNEIPFIVKFPKQVTASVAGLSAVYPPNVLAAVIRQEVHVDVSAVTDVDAKIRLYTSTQFPFRLNVGTQQLSSQPDAAAITLDSFANVVDCDDPEGADVPNAGENFALACGQEWLLDLQVNAAARCNIDGAYQVKFTAECHPDFMTKTDCPLVPDDQGEIQNEFVVDFTIDSEDFCPLVVDNVQVSAAMSVYKDAAHTVAATNFVHGQTAYFVVRASSPQVTVVGVVMDDIDVTVAPGEPNAETFNFYVDGVANAANPAGLGLSVQSSTNADEAWFKFVVASDAFVAPVDGSVDFAVDVVCNVQFKDAALNLLERKRVQLHQVTAGDSASEQPFAASVQVGLSNSDEETSGAGAMPIGVAGVGSAISVLAGLASV